MIRRLLSTILALGALACSCPSAKDELVVAMTQMPGTWNPIISSMLAKSLIANMTARPVTAYDADWKLVCLVCTEAAHDRERQGPVIDLADGKKGMEIDRRTARHALGRRHAGHRQGRGIHPGSRPASAVGRRLFRGLQADHQARRQGRPSLHHDDRPRHLRLQQHRPAAAAGPYRKADLRRQPGRVSQQDGLRHAVDQSRPRLRSLPHHRDPRRAAGSCWSRTRPGPARSPTSSASSSSIIENTAALEANLLSGSVDYVLGELGLSLDQAIAFEKRHKDKYNVIYKPALIWEHIDVNLDNKLLADKRVRQAMLLAIDRKAISEKLFEGKQPIAHGGISDARPDVQPGGAAIQLRCGRGPQAARRGGLLDHPQQCPPERRRREAVHRAGHHRRQPRPRAGGAGDPEPAPSGRHRGPPQGRAAAHLLRRDGQADLQRPGHVRLGAAPRGRAALVAPFPGNPDGRQRLERPELPGLRQSRDGQGARCSGARTRHRQATRPVRRDPANWQADDLPVAAAVLPRRSLRDPQAAQGRDADRHAQQLDPVGRAMALGDPDEPLFRGARPCRPPSPSC